MPDINIMALVSGGGANLQALINTEKAGGLGFGKLALVVSNRPGTYALKLAETAGIPAVVVEPDKTIPRDKRRKKLSDLILRLAEANHIDLIVLTGFLAILAGEILHRYSGKIINLHPALLPKFGGKDMYGEKVHRAVLRAGEKKSGCTVHLVDTGIDTGPILLQRTVPVLSNDTPETLAERIHREEHIAIVEAVKMMVEQLIS